MQNTNNNAEKLIKLLLKHNKTIASAESLTGGRVAVQLSSVPGASRAFLEGIVAYSVASKKLRLNVSQEDLKKYSAVSYEVAKSMAQGAKNSLSADFAVSTTGVAGPDDFDEAGNPRGLFYVGFAWDDLVEVESFRVEGSREEISRHAAEKAIEMAYEQIVGILGEED